MIVNSINPQIYSSRNKYYTNKQTSFQSLKGLKTLNAKELLTKKNAFRLGMGCFFSSVLLVLMNIKEPIDLDLLGNMFLWGSLMITDHKKKLDPNIKFYKANTIEEAKNYAKNTLGIKKFLIDDLEYANWINEGLTNISNKFKGEVYLPSKISFTNKKRGIASYNPLKDEICINKKNIEKHVSNFDSNFGLDLYSTLRDYNWGKGYKEFSKLLEKSQKDIKSLSVFEKLSLLDSFDCIAEIIAQAERKDFNKDKSEHEINKFGCVYRNPFNTIYHEMGHCFAYKSRPLWENLLNNYTKNSLIEGFKIPYYDKSQIPEFIACIFAGKMQGETYSEEIENLFEKLTKFKIPSK